MPEVLSERVVALSLDSDNFSRSPRALGQQIKETEHPFRLVGAGVERFEKTVPGTQSKLSMLKLTQQNRAVEQYSRALVADNQKLADAYTRQERMKAALVDARAAMERVRIATGNAATQCRHLASTLGESDSATTAAKANLERYKEEYKAARETADIDWAHIKNLATDTAIITQGVGGGTLYRKARRD